MILEKIREEREVDHVVDEIEGEMIVKDADEEVDRHQKKEVKTHRCI